MREITGEAGVCNCALSTTIGIDLEIWFRKRKNSNGVGDPEKGSLLGCG